MARGGEIVATNNLLRYLNLPLALRFVIMTLFTITCINTGNKHSNSNFGGSKNLKNLGEPCVLEDRPCYECSECDLCDQDPSKQCDNCGKCIEFPDGDFAEIEIDDILLNTDVPNTVSRHTGHSNKYKIKS